MIISVFILCLFFFIVNAGYSLGFVRSLSLARTGGWLLVFLSTIAAHFITIDSFPILRMAVIISATLFSMKSIVLVETYRGKPKLNYIQWLAFCTGWFGMRPQLFEKLSSPPLNDRRRLFFKGITRIFAGLVLLCIAVKTDLPWISSLLALTGMSFLLHFGILNLSTASWRTLGVDCRELFRSPALSKSLNEFWGKRWNLAFSEMTALAVYRPLKDKWSKGAAVLMAFLFSGILHETAISLPVQAGYGLPLLYFAIHGLLMMAEERVAFVKKITTHAVLSRLWVFGWLLLPMPLLFHKEFMGKIVFPLTTQITDLISNIF